MILPTLNPLYLQIVTNSMLVGLAPAHVASSKGRRFLLWWLFGTVLWVVAYPTILFLKPVKPDTAHPLVGIRNSKLFGRTP